MRTRLSCSTDGALPSAAPKASSAHVRRLITPYSACAHTAGKSPTHSCHGTTKLTPVEHAYRAPASASGWHKSGFGHGYVRLQQNAHGERALRGLNAAELSPRPTSCSAPLVLLWYPNRSLFFAWWGWWLPITGSKVDKGRSLEKETRPSGSLPRLFSLPHHHRTRRSPHKHICGWRGGPHSHRGDRKRAR